MQAIYTNFYLFIMAVVLALMEIQTEGRHGWAGDLPTWRPSNQKWYVRCWRRLMNDKDLTGYHAGIFGFVFLVFHLPYVFGFPFTLSHWSQTLSLFFLFVVLWDFLWFVLNPYYPLSEFKKEHIWWHKKWLALAPTDYYSGILVSLLIQIIAAGATYSWWPLGWWLLNFGLFSLLTLVVVWISHSVLDIDNWSKK